MVAGVPALTVERKGTTTKTHHIHADHLGSTNVTTDDQGLVAQSISYRPFGEEKAVTGKNTVGRHYIGQTYDTDTSLNYLNARYYRSDRGQFLSQDPVFNEVGLTDDGKMILLNPQLANSYSYAGNNPISGKDPSGRAREDARRDAQRHAQAYTTQKKQEMYRGAEARFHKGIDLMGKAGMTGAAGVGVYAGMRVAPSATVGAVTNTLGTVGANRISGRATTNKDLINSAIVGGILGQTTSNMATAGTMITTAGVSAIATAFTGSQSPVQDVSSDTLAAGAAKTIQNSFSPQQVGTYLRASIGAVSEVGVKTALTFMFSALAR